MSSARRSTRGAPFSAARARADEIRADVAASASAKVPRGPDFIVCLSPSQNISQAAIMAGASAAPAKSTESSQSLSELGKSVFERLLLAATEDPRRVTAASPTRGAAAVWAALSLPLEQQSRGDSTPTYKEELAPSIQVRTQVAQVPRGKNVLTPPTGMTMTSTHHTSANKSQRQFQTPRTPLSPPPAHSSPRQQQMLQSPLAPTTPARQVPAPAPLSAVSAAAAFKLALARASAEMTACAEEIAAAKESERL